MKFRIDFVTNSSSSSYVTMNIKCPALARLCEEFYEILEAEDGFYVSVVGDDVTMNVDEGYLDVPASLQDVPKAITAIIMMYEGYDDEEYENEPPQEGTRAYIAWRIMRLSGEIIADIQDVDITMCDIGWQGDSDARYDQSNYSEEELAEVYATIAEEKGCDISEITDEDFDEYVCDKVSNLSHTYQYIRSINKETIIKSMELD